MMTEAAPVVAVGVGIVGVTGSVVFLTVMPGATSSASFWPEDGFRLLEASSCEQQEPNMKPSMHMPMWFPSVLMHSHTNMHTPSTPPTLHALWAILL